MRLAPRRLRATPLLALTVLALLALAALASHGSLHGSVLDNPAGRPLAHSHTHLTFLPHAGHGSRSTVSVPGWLVDVGLAIVAAGVAGLLIAYVRVPLPRWHRIAVAPPAKGSAAGVPDQDEAQVQLRAIVDRSVEELRADPDARRAIIGAYHLMERALDRAGLPRAPSEAPREYLDRALAAVKVGPQAPRRLTALFERARFGGAELELGLRDEAIDALLALREDLA